MVHAEGFFCVVNGDLSLLGEGIAAYQLVGEVMAHQGYDG